MPVYNEVAKLIDLCVKEYMGSLQYMAALPYGSCSDSEEEFTLLNLNSLRGVQSNEYLLVNDCCLDCAYIIELYSPWLTNKEDLTTHHDILISHRWNGDDDKVVDELCDAFCDHVIGPENRAFKVFLDKDIVSKGHQFQREYGNAVINSTILVPLLSTSVLKKLSNHKPEEEDNVLIQWMLALECMQDPIHSKMRGIYPLMISEWMADGLSGDHFTEGILIKLPVTVPVACIKIVRTLLKENGIAESSFLSNWTVRSVVNEISSLGGCQKDFSVREASDKIVAKLNQGLLNI